MRQYWLTLGSAIIKSESWVFILFLLLFYFIVENIVCIYVHMYVQSIFRWSSVSHLEERLNLYIFLQTPKQTILKIMKKKHWLLEYIYTPILNYSFIFNFKHGGIIVFCCFQDDAGQWCLGQLREEVWCWKKQKFWWIQS